MTAASLRGSCTRVSGARSVVLLAISCGPEISVMPRFIPFLIVASVLQFGMRPASGDELWTYYFVADGSRPYFQPCYGDCALSGTRADLAGTFSILLNWQTGFGKLYSLDAQLVNMASVRSTLGGEILIPAVPSYSTHGVFPTGAPAKFADSMFSYIQGSGRLKSPDLIPSDSQPYDITFGLTNATLSMTILDELPFGIPLGYQASSIINARATLLNARVAGEFTNDNGIDARDYVALRKSGRPPLDYTLWRKYYGTVTSVAAGAGVPEPPALMLLVGAIAAIVGRGWRPVSRRCV